MNERCVVGWKDGQAIGCIMMDSGIKGWIENWMDIGYEKRWMVWWMLDERKDGKNNRLSLDGRLENGQKNWRNVGWM